MRKQRTCEDLETWAERILGLDPPDDCIDEDCIKEEAEPEEEDL